MRVPFAFLGLSTQIPFQSKPSSCGSSMATQNDGFAFKEAPDIFSPKDLVSSGVVCGPNSDFEHVETILRFNLGGQAQRLLMPKEILHSCHTANTPLKRRSEKFISIIRNFLIYLSGTRNRYSLFLLLEMARRPISQ